MARKIRERMVIGKLHVISTHKQVPRLESLRLELSSAWSAAKGEALSRRIRCEPVHIFLHYADDKMEAWSGISWACNSKCNVILGRPFGHRQSNDWFGVRTMVHGWRELFVHIAAHELWHLLTKTVSINEQEVECERVGIQAVNLYRRCKGRA